MTAAHGHRRHPDYDNGPSPTYTSWRCMHRRCYDEKHPSYKHYGAAGVEVVERWHTFANFLEDMGERPSKDHTLGRVTPFSDYGPGECEWQLRAVQNKGLRSTGKDVITIGDVSRTKSQWAEALGLKYRSLTQRLRRGWKESAFTLPHGTRRPTSNHLRFRVD